MVIDIKKIIGTHNIPTDYIVHAGAHEGQELELYASLNPKEVWLFEPQVKVYEKLTEKAKSYPWAKTFNHGLGSTEGTLPMFISEGNDGQSSSFLEPLLHKTQFSFVKFPGTKEEAKILKLEKLLAKKKKFKPTILSMDTQGFELEILKGAGSYIENFRMIISEFSTQELYKGIPYLRDLEAYLGAWDFRKVETKFQGSNWGDVVFLK